MQVTPRKLAANRANLAQAGPITEKGRERLRQVVRQNRPWEHSTGPRTAAGKNRAKMNSLRHGRETAERRAWRKDALRFIRLDLQLRGMTGEQPSSIQVDEVIAELRRLSARLASVMDCNASGHVTH